MKNTALWLTLLLALARAASAQVTVEVLLERNQFLPNETMNAKVRIVNNSGQTLHFGKDDWLSYSIEATDGFVVIKNGNAPIAHDFDVKSSEVATARADLSPYFDISKPGGYSVTATVRIKDWQMQVSSTPKHFDVVRGVSIWEQSFGVPQSPGDHSEPEIRKYILQQATFSRHSELFLRLTDGGTHTLRLLTIGPTISFSAPQMRLDPASNLHLLYQQAAHVYDYSVISPSGEITKRQTYYYTSSAPHLRVDDTGNIFIVGGERHIAENDLPSPPKYIVPTNDIPLPVPR
ncbi:MAG TPA: hypothetical protein VH413_18625 [Verrucomicrobiae bacterium]|jgi:hypothetical protein|nr:hypothetical protein [Verrucomicrobiae bacterium]